MDKGLAAAIAIVVGFFSFFAVLNVNTAYQRGKQKQTMADIRSIATAWEARASDTNSYTIAPDDNTSRCDDMGDFRNTHRVAAADLKRALEPTYIRKLPLADGWGNAFDFRTGDYDHGVAKSYAIRSLGKGGKAERERYAGGNTDDFKADIVYSNGSFFEFPEGA